jgi:hypothetical protein
MSTSFCGFFRAQVLCARLGLPAVLFAMVASIAGQATAAVITEWNFNTIGATSPPINSPAPSTGVGTAVTLGMDNAYNGGNTAADDILPTPGVANPAFNLEAWRIRGSAHNGWATHGAGRHSIARASSST